MYEKELTINTYTYVTDFVINNEVRCKVDIIKELLKVGRICLKLFVFAHLRRHLFKTDHRPWIVSFYVFCIKTSFILYCKDLLQDKHYFKKLQQVKTF